VPLIALARDEHHPGWRSAHSEPVPLPDNATPTQNHGASPEDEGGASPLCLASRRSNPYLAIIKSVMGFASSLCAV